MLVRWVPLLVASLLLASCDQFARVGTLEASADVKPPPPRDDGGGTMQHDASAQDAAARDSGSDGGERDGGEGGEQCSSVTSAVCDPVTNQGCPGALGMQCAIDYAATLTGYCIFDAPPGPLMPAECLNTLVTESCPPTFTCFADHCEKICLCDAHCDPGRCCSQPVEATGFRVCGDC